MEQFLNANASEQLNDVLASQLPYEVEPLGAVINEDDLAVTVVGIGPTADPEQGDVFYITTVTAAGRNTIALTPETLEGVVDILSEALGDVQ